MIIQKPNINHSTQIDQYKKFPDIDSLIVIVQIYCTYLQNYGYCIYILYIPQNAKNPLWDFWQSSKLVKSAVFNTFKIRIFPNSLQGLINKINRNYTFYSPFIYNIILNRLVIFTMLGQEFSISRHFDKKYNTDREKI